MSKKKVVEGILTKPKPENVAKLSLRKQFNQIQFDPKLLEFIKTNNIGKVRVTSSKQEQKSDLDKVTYISVLDINIFGRFSAGN
jgi:hypothetical protein